MSTIEDRLAQLGFELPQPLKLPPGVTLPFPWVRVVGSRAIISGHGPTTVDGELAQPLGKVGAEVTEEQGYVAARLTGLAILASLKRELGSLERIACWSRIFGMVNSAPGFHRQPAVINGFTDLIINVFGPERGAHARSVVGLAKLPFASQSRSKAKSSYAAMTPNHSLYDALREVRVHCIRGARPVARYRVKPASGKGET
jgi:enamine deaminase RidA (YjgF/YER057c/UK114 family)